MRLIDADNFLERFEKMCETETDNVIAMVLRGALVDEPTAYDVDKIVEQLTELVEFCKKRRNIVIDSKNDDITKKSLFSRYEGMMIAYAKAIEIVKQGGVSDNVCEEVNNLKIRETPMAAVVTGHNNAINTDVGDCPRCGRGPLRACDFGYCPECGQKLSW